MIKLCRCSSRLVLVASLIASLAASRVSVARAEDRNPGKQVGAAPMAFCPIGTVYSLGALSINGHPARGEQLLWNGDMLAASDDARVLLGSIGEVRLTPGTAVRLTTRSPGDTGT